MAIGVTDSKHYEAIADVIRERLGTDEKYKPEEMADRVIDVNDSGYYDGFFDGEDQGFDDGYDQGYTDGYDEGLANAKPAVEPEGEIIFDDYISSGDYYEGAFTVEDTAIRKLYLETNPVYEEYPLHIERVEVCGYPLITEKYFDAGVYEFAFTDEMIEALESDGYAEISLYIPDSDGVSVTIYVAGEEKTYEDGYEAGKQARDAEWWADHQAIDGSNGYLHFSYAGACWNKETFTPYYDVKNYSSSGANAVQMFYQHNHDRAPYDMAEHLDKLGVALDTSKFAAMGQCFRYAAISKLGVIDTTAITSKTNSAHLVANSKLVTIDKIVMKTRTFDWSGNEFLGCNLLEHLTIEGEIGNNGLNFSDCPLDHDSLMSIIVHLKDFSGTSETRSITFGATNLAKLTDADKAKATQKGWTLA
ncbi:MAG: hypothetical protein IKM48_03110 [Clostridia bacterium]|nr:hypothetical protein [Clostridia bacterium]